MKSTPHPVEHEELMAYLDGELPVERASALAAHLNECPDCQGLSKELRGVSERLTAWQVEPSSAQLAEKVTAAVREVSLQKKSDSARQVIQSRRPVLRWALGLSAAGTALVLLIAFSMPYLLKSRQAVELPPNRALYQLDVSPPRAAGGGSGKPIAGNGAGGNKYPGPNYNRPQEAESNPGPMIARTANLILVTKDFDTVHTAIERIGNAHQGYIAKLDTTGQKGSARNLSATLRVPSDQLATVIAELKKLGTVIQETQNGEEVTDQYVDLKARLVNARVTEQRLTEILRNRTGKVEDVLNVEREIARVRGEIERMDAQRKNLEKRVAYSTVTVQVREDYRAEIEVTPPSTGTRLWNATVDGYHGVVDTVLGLALAMLRYGPMLLFWALLLFWPARRVWRLLRTQRS